MAQLYKMTLYVCDLDDNLSLDEIKTRIEQYALDDVAVNCLCHFADEQIGPQIEWDDDIDLNRMGCPTSTWDKYFDDIWSIDMDKFERGKRAELGVYDDACGFTDEEMKLYWEMLRKDSVDTGINVFDDRLWIEGDDGTEMIVPSPCSLHDKATAEKHKKIIDELNSLGCTSFTITSEQIKSLLNKKDD